MKYIKFFLIAIILFAASQNAFAYSLVTIPDSLGGYSTKFNGAGNVVGQYYYVRSGQNGDIAKIDTISDTLVATIASGCSSETTNFGEVVGNLIYYVCNNLPEIKVLDTTNDIVTTYPTITGGGFYGAPVYYSGSNMLYMSPNSSGGDMVVLNLNNISDPSDDTFEPVIFTPITETYQQGIIYDDKIYGTRLAKSLLT